jgi:hypothetical protein
MSLMTFRTKLLPPFSGYLADEDTAFLREVGNDPPDCTASHHQGWPSQPASYPIGGTRVSFPEDKLAGARS